MNDTIDKLKRKIKSLFEKNEQEEPMSRYTITVVILDNITEKNVQLSVGIEPLTEETVKDSTDIIAEIFSDNKIYEKLGNDNNE